MSKSSWTRAEVISAIGIIVAIASIGLSLTQPEVRHFLGLQQVALTPVAQIHTIKQSFHTNPTPKPNSIVFDNFNNGIGEWGIIGSDVSYVQDEGNNILRFNPPDKGPAEAYKQVNSAVLSRFRKISLRINLHGASLVAPTNDPNYQTASALYLDQNGWKFVGLYNFIKNSYDGWQNVEIPLTVFIGFDKNASFSRLGFRFWLYKAGTIDVDDIAFVS